MVLRSKNLEVVLQAELCDLKKKISAKNNLPTLDTSFVLKLHQQKRQCNLYKITKTLM